MKIDLENISLNEEQSIKCNYFVFRANHNKNHNSISLEKVYCHDNDINHKNLTVFILYEVEINHNSKLCS